MKKIVRFILNICLVASLVLLVGCKNSTTTQTTENTTKKTTTTETGTKDPSIKDVLVYIHYFRYQSDYDDWNVWAWEKEPLNKTGSEFKFTTDSGVNSYEGVVATITIDTSYKSLGFLIRKGNWDEKDIQVDRFITIPSTISETNPLHIYVLEATEKFGYSLDDAPAKEDKFKSAWFKDENIIYAVGTADIDTSSLKVFKGEDEISIKSTAKSDDGYIAYITLNEIVDYNATYLLKGTFDKEKEISVTFQGLYDFDGFKKAFSYTGSDLGCYASSKGTTFRLWAPVSISVTLNLYDTGTTLSYSTTDHPGTNTPTKTIKMEKSEKGTWYYKTDENLHGTYYTYTVENAGKTSEVVDPYAKGCGVNGERGLVVDFSLINPADFEYGKTASSVTKNTDSIIYELHVRDFSIDDSWTGTSKKGTFDCLFETGTTYKTYKTGFDHLKDLGINSLQLLPIYDYSANVDESRMDENLDNTNINEDDYNWGYMPLNYNCLEGSYSKNPFDGLVRIKEFKELTTAYNNADIGITMDVVYNHSGLSAGSNFELIVPGYYLRLKEDGTYSDASGCGNELASERDVVRKFIVDSVCFWAYEYNLSGFRFDLMAVIDTITMNEIYSALKEINPNIVVYGEPWSSGESTLSSSLMSTTENINNIPNIGAFSDNFREKVKNFCLGNNEEYNYNMTKCAIAGKNREENGVTCGSPGQCINYVACHDGLTLNDFIRTYKSGVTDTEVLNIAKEAYSFIFLSQGMAFIHAGDEFLRSKVDSSGKYVENSYNSGDKVNGIDWTLLEKNSSMNEYMKEMIAFRKAHESLKLSTNEDFNNSVYYYSKSDLGNNSNNLIAVVINNRVSNDSYENILFYTGGSGQSFSMTGGDWILAFKEEGFDPSATIWHGSNQISVKQNETLVFYQLSTD